MKNTNYIYTVYIAANTVCVCAYAHAPVHAHINTYTQVFILKLTHIKIAKNEKAMAA